MKTQKGSLRAYEGPARFPWCLARSYTQGHRVLLGPTPAAHNGIITAVTHQSRP